MKYIFQHRGPNLQFLTYNPPWMLQASKSLYVLLHDIQQKKSLYFLSLDDTIRKGNQPEISVLR